VPWGQCYDRNFLGFLPIFGEKMAFFSKNNVFFLIIEAAHISGPHFPRLNAILLTKNRFGYVLADFFHKLIWSPRQKIFV
jgi:hypothetical protein